MEYRCHTVHLQQPTTIQIWALSVYRMLNNYVCFTHYWRIRYHYLF